MFFFIIQNYINIFRLASSSEWKFKIGHIQTIRTDKCRFTGTGSCKYVGGSSQQSLTINLKCAVPLHTVKQVNTHNYIHYRTSRNRL